jgi:hypothetical protein
MRQNDLKSVMDVFECDFEFIVEEIQKYQNLGLTSQQVILKKAIKEKNFDDFVFTNIMNNDLNKKVYEKLSTDEARVFWLSFFKNNSAVTSDIFFNAMREITVLNFISSEYFN